MVKNIFGKLKELIIRNDIKGLNLLLNTIKVDFNTYLDVYNKTDQNLLEIAIFNQNLTIIKILLELEHPVFSNKYGHSVFYALSLKRYHSVIFLLEHSVYNFNIKDLKNGFNIPTYFIVNNWSIEILEKYNINNRSFCFKLKTPLMYLLSKKNFSEKEVLLVLKNSDPGLIDIDGNTLLHYISSSNYLFKNISLLNLIRKHTGPLKFLPNNKGETSLSFIMKDNNYQILNLFLKSELSNEIKIYENELLTVTNFILNKKNTQFPITIKSFLKQKIKEDHLEYILKEIILNHKYRLKFFYLVLIKNNYDFSDLFLKTYSKYEDDFVNNYYHTLQKEDNDFYTTLIEYLSQDNFSLKNILLDGILSSKLYNRDLFFTLIKLTGKKPSVIKLIEEELSLLSKIKVPSIYMFKYKYEYEKNIKLETFSKIINLDEKYDKKMYLYYGLKFLNSN